MGEVSRRAVLGATAAGLLTGAAAVPKPPPEPEGAVIGWPVEPPGWDPALHAVPQVQSLYKLVFDQPLDLDPDLKLIPSLVAKWELAPDAKSLTLDLRDGVAFHNGDPLTSEDIQWSFLGRTKAGQKTDLAAAWPWPADIETPSPSRAILRFAGPVPSAAIRLASIGAFVVPKAAMAKTGPDAFAAKPIGTGPYKFADIQAAGRITLERNEAYWGAKPKLKRIVIDVIREPASRTAAVEVGRVDFAVDLPMLDMARLTAMPNLVAELAPITRIILLQIRGDQGFANPDIRLAAHHAIDKRALSQAVYGGGAVPLSVLATPGSPGFVDGYSFAYDPALARQLLAKSGHGPDQPAKIRMATTNGQFPGDIDLARAIVQMWQTVGIAAELETFEYAKYVDLNRANYLPDATLYAWDNATGDPALYIGTLLNPKLPYSAWKDMALGQKIIDMSAATDPAASIEGWRALNREATETGATIPLLQGTQSTAHKKALTYTKYRNGWILGQTLGWN